VTSSLSKTEARITGLWYLGLAISGMLGFLVVRNQLFVHDDAGATFTNLTEHEGLARLGIALDLTIVVTQALAALWFYRLFRSVHSFAAASLTCFGLINAVAVLIATAFTVTALDSALDAGTTPAGDQAATAQLLFNLNDATWGVASLFFGLWLIPMGYLVLRSGSMPRLLGYVLEIGGVTYVLSAYVTYLWLDAPGVILGGLTTLPTIGEFWIVGYLLVIGVRPTRPIETEGAR